MKNLSIRTKILTGVVVVNLLGTIVAMVFLHQSYGATVDASAAKSTAMSGATWEALQEMSADAAVTSDSKVAGEYLERMKKITGSDYALLVTKEGMDAKAYAVMRTASGLPDNFNEGDTYAMLATTNDKWVEDFQFKPTPDAVPEIGKLVGVKNGACSKACHSGVTAEGDYWGIAWSNLPGVSQVHSVYPVASNGQPIGVLYTIQDISAEADAARSSMNRTLILICATFLIATLLIGGMIDSFVFKRLNRMMLAIEDVSVRVAGGDFDARFVPEGRSDEIGHFEQFFSHVLELMTGTIKSLMQQK